VFCFGYENKQFLHQKNSCSCFGHHIQCQNPGILVLPPVLHHSSSDGIFICRLICWNAPDNSFYSGLYKVHQTQVDMIELIGGLWLLYCSSPKNGGVTAVQSLILIPVKEQGSIFLPM
jgi:hypothetical protein